MAFLTGRRKNLGGLLWPPKALPVSVFSASAETIGAPTLFEEPKRQKTFPPREPAETYENVKPRSTKSRRELLH